MPEDDVLGRVAGQVADGRSIDWQALEQLVGSDTERAELQCLRMVDALGRAHRSDSVTHTAPAEPLHGDRPPSPVPGARPWGRYQLLQEVGAGSYGSVHRAWDPDLKKEVAIKILHRHVDDTALRARLLHEGRALARVDDPHVVRVLGVESYGNRVGLCMEFVHGDTLDAVLRSHGTLNAGEAALVGQDVCRALAAVHLAGFVHRDVKPRNIMRDRTGRIVLMDFGTGQDIVDPTGEGRMNIAGTPPYMAPEVLAGQPATVASDVYSVGVLLYHLVTSAYPVEGRTIDEITAAHLQGRRTPLGQRRPDLPLPFMGIVERAIAVRPEERWPSAATLREALGQVDGETGIDWRQIAVRLAAGLGLVAGAGGALIGLGAINSKYYNSFVLGREGFVRESLWDWMYFGALSLTAPLVLLMLALLGLSLLLVLWQLLINVSDTGRRLDAFAARAAGRLKLDDASVASNWALLASAGVFVAAWWANLPMLSKLTELFPDISTAPVEQLAFLAPDHFFEREDYRVWFTWSTILGAAVWVPVFRLAARQGKTVSPLMLLAGAVVVALSSALLDLPYRAFSQSELETATWQGERCYVLGERAEDVLVFCPELAPPRSHVVDRGATSLQRLGVKENVFARIRSAK